MSWECVEDACIEVLGATSTSLEGNSAVAPHLFWTSVLYPFSDTVFIVGGLPKGRSDSNHLDVHCFDPISAELKCILVNTNGLLNRAYHAAIGRENEILIFGGSFSDGTITADILRCSLSDEGFCTELLCQNGVGRKGMVAAAVGPGGDSAVVFFGGYDGTDYFDDVVVIKGDISAKSDIESISLQGDKPSARAFSACCVLGDNNEFVVVSGGRNACSVFDDIWVLDVTKMIPELNENESAPPVKGSKGKNPSSDEPLKWTKLTASLPEGRFEHNSYCYRDSNGKISIHITGGLSATGPISLAPISLSLSISSGVPTEDDVISLSEVVNLAPRYGGTVSTIKENGAVIGAFLFGGISSDGVSQTCFNCVDSSSKLARCLGDTISKRKTKKLVAEGFDADEEAKDKAEVFEYENGDCYSGEVWKDSGTRLPHGTGTMRYADGSSYEVPLYFCTYSATLVDIVIM